MLSAAALGWGGAFQGLNINISSVRVEVESSERSKFQDVVDMQWSRNGKRWQTGTAKVRQGKVLYLKMISQNNAEQKSSKVFKARALKPGKGSVAAGAIRQLMDPFWGMPEGFYNLKSFSSMISYLNGSMARTGQAYVSSDKVVKSNVSSIDMKSAVYGASRVNVKVIPSK